jgi:hypothetical protein
MRAIFLVFALSCFGCAQMGPASEWSADTGAGAVADDNWLFNEQDISSVGVSASIDAAAKFAGPTYEFGLDGNASRTDFESNELPDAEEYGLSLHAAHEYSLGESRVAAGFRSRDTLLGVQDTDNIAAVNETERTTWAVASSSRELGPRTAASISVTGSRVRYASPTPDRNDFDFGSLGLGAEYEITPLLVGSLRLVADGYQTEAAPVFLRGIPIGTEQQRAYSIGPAVGAVWEPMERYQVTAEISARRRSNSSDVTLAIPGLPSYRNSAQNIDPEYLGELGLARAFDRGILRIGVDRKLVPSSLGRLRTRDTANVYASRELSAFSSLSIGASVAFEEEEASLVSNRRVALTNTRWVNAELSYAHKWGPNVAVTATYRYRTQSSEDIDSINGNGVSVTVTYAMGSAT